MCSLDINVFFFITQNPNKERIMRKGLALILLVGVAVFSGFSTPVQAAPGQLGSVLMFPLVRVNDGNDTYVSIVNTDPMSVDIKCFAFEGNEPRGGVQFQLKENEHIIFSAKDHHGIEKLRISNSNCAMVCFATNPAGTEQISWNKLYGTARVHDFAAGANMTYGARAFSAYVEKGLPVGKPGRIKFTGKVGAYEAFPRYAHGSFFMDGMPLFDTGPVHGNMKTGIALVFSKIDLRQDFVPVKTKAFFSIWNESRVKTSATTCAETRLDKMLGSISSSFTFARQHSTTGRIRVEGTKSTVCPGSEALGVLGLLYDTVEIWGSTIMTATSLIEDGTVSGVLLWDPDLPVAEIGKR